MKTPTQTLQTLAVAAAAAAMLTAQPVEDRRLVFSTFHGGDRTDDAAAVAVDEAGNIYVTGETDSRDLPHSPLGGKPLTYAVSKGYLTKYSPKGKEVLWRLLIGGSSNTVPRALTLDRDGNVYVAGSTGARDLPMKNPVQDKHPGLNIAFLMKFNPKGELLFSTLHGGERNDDPRVLAVDSANNVYMAGRATSTTFPVKDALQPKIAGSDDGFIAKFTADGKLAYSTYLGGPSSDNITSIAVGPDDSLYVTGESWSAGLSTPGAYISRVQSYSSFAARIAPDGSAVRYFTYVGWSGGYTVARAIAVDAEGQAWVGGHTSAKQIPTLENAIQPRFAGGMRDGFLLRLSEDGTAATYLSYLGGSFSGPADPDETINALRVDRRGHVHIAGHTNSRDFPGRRALQGDLGGAYDAFVTRLDAANKQFIYSTFWGGAKNDQVQALALGPGEAVTAVGESFSPDLPLANAVQTKIGSLNDAFVAQVCEPFPFAWTGSGFGGEVSYTVGGARPEPVEIEIHTGCPQPFPVGAAPESSASWLAPVANGGTLPMKLKLEINPEGLAAGEYKASVRITVPDAFYPVLELPVVLRVADPPPPPAAPAEGAQAN